MKVMLPIFKRLWLPSLLFGVMLSVWLCAGPVFAQGSSNVESPTAAPKKSKCTPFEQMSVDGYMKRHQSKVLSYWPIIKTKKPMSVTVEYNITPEGALSDLTLAEGSESEKLNKKALRAIEKAAPFEPLPEFDCVKQGLKDGLFPFKMTLNSQPKSSFFADNPRGLRNNRLVIIKAADEDLNPGRKWLKTLKQEIKDQWDYVLPGSIMPVIVHCVITREGHLEKFKVIDSSGDGKKDKSAKKALKLSAPFKPLPAEFNAESIELEIRLF